MSRSSIIVAAALVAAFLAACGGGGPRGGERGPVPVEVAETSAERVAVDVRAVGTLRAEEEVQVRAERAGRVRSIEFTEGTRVERGDVLVRLDAEERAARVDELEARLRQARARLEEERGALERRRPLVEKQLVSEEEFRSQEQAVAAAEADVEASMAALRQARKALRDATIVAPVAGVVGERLVSRGDYLDVSDLVVRLYDVDPLEVSFRVPERYLARLAEGQEVELQVAAFSRETFQGTVFFLDPAVDPITRTVGLKARVPNDEGLLRPGLFARVDVLLDVREDAAVVPEQAIVSREDGDWIFVVEEGVARRRRVSVGQRMPGKVEILEGVVPGERVVTAGQQKLAEGAEVRILEETPPSTEGQEG